MKITDKSIEAALKKYRGNISETAKALNVERITIYRRMEQNPELQYARTEAEEARLDEYEAAIDKAALVNCTPRQSESDHRKLADHLTQYIAGHGLPSRYGDVMDYIIYLREQG